MSEYYYFFFYLILLFALNINKGKKLFLFTAIYLVLFAGTKDVGVDRDSLQYLRMYDSFQDYFSSLKFGVEPAISIISAASRKIGFDNVYSLFLVLTFIGVTLKIRGIIKYSPIPLLSVFLYYCYIYFKQDFTQLRAAAATGIFLWAIDDIFAKNFIFYIIKIFLACCFHASALIYIPIYFINTSSINKKLYLIITAITFILANLKVTKILLKMPVISHFSRLQLYTDKVTHGATGSDVFNPLGILFAFQLLIAIILIYFADTIAKKDKYGIFFVKLIAIGNICLYLLGGVAATIATRVCELFYVTLFISGVYPIYFIKPKYCGVFFSFLIGVLYWVFQMFYDPIMMPYNSWLSRISL